MFYFDGWLLVWWVDLECMCCEIVWFSFKDVEVYLDYSCMMGCFVCFVKLIIEMMLLDLVSMNLWDLVVMLKLGKYF